MKTLVAALLFPLFLSCLLVEISAEEHLVTLTHGGQVRGRTLKSQNGRTIYAFRAIPYAEPPIGALRFKKPVPKAAWKDQILDATADGPICVQLQQPENVIGHEDCLHLNVYTPKLPQLDHNETKMAVMVYIHGGGLSAGSSASTIYGPGRLLDEDIILVSMNYRLGPLGFLSTGDTASPGNYGLMDQSLALQWVKDHIEVFGGDAKQVTLFGESAGAVSVGLHLLSPMSAGLFHTAIAQSGSPLFLSTIQENPMYWTKRLAADLECPTQHSAEMVECLRQIPAVQMIKLPNQYTKHGLMPFAFVPVVDGSFLPKKPRQIIISGEANRVPYLSGINKDEGLLVYGSLYLQAISDLKPVLVELFKYSLDNEGQADEAVNLIMNEYFSQLNWTDKDSTRRAIVKAFSDFMFIMPHYEMMNLLAKNDFRIYTYSLDYMPSVGQMLQYLGIKEKWGVCHGDDLGFLFDGNQSLLKNPTTDDQKIIKVFCSAWTNFAKHGQPTSAVAQEAILKWTPSAPGKMEVYHIDNPLRTSTYEMNSDYLYRFWTEVIPQHLTKTVR